MAISGLSYKAIDFGPVPVRWDVIYSEFDEIHQELRSVGDFVGSVLTSTDKANLSLFTESEIKVMDNVLAWTNHHDRHEIIPFSEAFHLKAV